MDLYSPFDINADAFALEENPEDDDNDSFGRKTAKLVRGIERRYFDNTNSYNCNQSILYKCKK